MELVDFPPRSPAQKFAQAGGGIHHVCYEVNDLKAQVESTQQAGCHLVRTATAFGGRKIAW